MNHIHHSVVFLDRDSVYIGTDNYIGPNVVIGANVTIGSRNRIEAHSCIGLPGEKYGFFHSMHGVQIGSDNVIREFTTIQSGTKGITRMGDHCVMLRGSHLSHDSVLEDCCNVSCNCLIGGESFIMKGANLGLGCVLHQRSLIGSYAMVGMGAVITKTAQVKPGQMWYGNPARYVKENTIGLQRANVTQKHFEVEMERWESKLHEVCDAH